VILVCSSCFVVYDLIWSFVAFIKLLGLVDAFFLLFMRSGVCA
jgi:hypothetical protein